jgi:hypothetical protein
MGDVYPRVSSRVQGARPLPFHYGDVMVMPVLLMVKRPINHLFLSFSSVLQQKSSSSRDSSFPKISLKYVSSALLEYIKSLYLHGIKVQV